MRKLSLVVVILMTSISPVLASGEQYVESYNKLVDAINERIGASLTKKNEGDSVTQGDLNKLRSAVSGLLPDGKRFTMVPGDYTSAGQTIYSNSFDGVPIFWIHFEELRDVINSIGTTKIETIPNNVLVSYGGGRGCYGFSTSSIGDAVANAEANWWEEEPWSFTWSGQTLYKQSSYKVWWGVPYSYSYDAYAWHAYSLTLSMTVPESVGRISAKLYVREGIYEGTAEWKWVEGEEGGWWEYACTDPSMATTKYEWKVFGEHSGSGSGEISKTEQISFSWCADPPVPPPGWPEWSGIVGEGWRDYSIAGIKLVSEYPLTEVELEKPGGEKPADDNADGIVFTGCECATCPPGMEAEWEEMENYASVDVPLNISGESESGLKVKAYIRNYSDAGKQFQMYSLDTKVLTDMEASGCDPENPENKYKFVWVKRPSGAEVWFSIYGTQANAGNPGNTKDYSLTEVTENQESYYDLYFPDSEVTHRFNQSAGRLIQVRKKAAGQAEMFANGNGTRNWPGLTTVYDDDKMIEVTGPLYDTFPVYIGEFIVDKKHEKDGVPVCRSEKTTEIQGDETIVTLSNYDDLDRLFSKTVIISNPAAKTTAVKIIDPTDSSVAEETVRTETTDENGNMVLTDTVTVNGQNAVNSRTIKSFPWGDEIIEERTAPAAPDEKITTYTYYDNPEADAGAYGRLKTIINWDTSWIRYEYDEKGRISKVITPFLNSGVNSDENSCRVTEYSYTPVAPGDVEDFNDHRPRTIIEKVLGTEVSRTYNIHTGNRSETVRCASPGASWDAAGNLVTISEAYNSGDFQGRPLRTVNADGTIVVYNYSLDSGILTTTVDSGAGSGYAVSDGTRTVTESDPSGNTLFSASYDISSAIQLSSETYTLDVFGRTIRVDYMDNTHTETVYGCCGPESHTSREGTVTTSAYTGLKQLSYTTTAGITNFYDYDAFGNVVAETRKGSDGSAITTTSTYNTAGELISSTDAMGNTTTYEEKKTENRIQKTVVFPDSSTSITTYNVDGTIAETSGTAVHGVKYEYGVENGELYTKVIPIGNETQWTKSYTDFLGRTPRVIFGDGSASTTFYDSAGRAVKQVDPAGVVTLYQYNAKGELELTAIDINNNGVIDLAGPDRVTKYEDSVLSANGANVRRAATYIFPENNETPVEASINDTEVSGLQSWSSSFGRTVSSSTVYNGGGQKTVTTTNPDGSTVTNSYLNGLLQSSEILSSDFCLLTSYTYDPHNRLASETKTINNQPQTTSYSYNNNDQITQITDPASRITSYQYDAVGRRTGLAQPGNRTINYTYSLTGELASVSGADTYPVSYTYDSMGRLKTLTDGNGNTTTWNYDPLRGFMTAKTYADGNSVSYTYNPDGALQTRTWSRVTHPPDGGQPVVSSYSYNTAGDLQTLDYSDSTPDVSYTRDRFGRPVSVTDSTGTHTLAYNSDSSLASATIPHLPGHTLEYGYDALGRRTSLALGPAPYALSHTYTYDSMSRLASVGNGSITANYARVPGSNLISATNITNDTNNILTVNRTYDSLNRLTSISNSTTLRPLDLPTFDYQYNDRDQRTKVTLLDGSYWEYAYDDLGQVTSGKKFDSAGTAIPGQSFEYTFDSIGNRTQCSTGVPTCEYSYSANALNQYTQRTIPGVIPVIGEAAPDATVKIHRVNLGEVPEAILTPDRTGKYFSEIIEVDNSSQSVEELLDIYCHKVFNGNEIAEKVSRWAFIPKNPEEFTHDPDGNLLSDGRFTYTYDAENRMISAESNAGIPACRLKIEFSYDYMSRRVEKKVFNWDSETNAYCLLPVAFSKYIYDGMNCIAEFDAVTNTLLKSYLWGLDVTGSLQAAGGVGGLVCVRAGLDVYFPVYDGNGNVVAYLDSSGNKAAEFEYSPSPDIIVKSGLKADELAEVASFSTKPYCKELDAFLYQLRILKNGRFLSRDPIGEQTYDRNAEEMKFNLLYPICSNDTVNKWDYLGFKESETLVVIFLSRIDAKADVDMNVGISVLAKIDRNLIWKYEKEQLPTGKQEEKQEERDYKKECYKAVYFVNAKLINAKSLRGPIGVGDRFSVSLYANRVKQNFDDLDLLGELDTSVKALGREEAYFKIGGMLLSHEVVHSVGKLWHIDQFGKVQDQYLMTKKPTFLWIFNPPILHPNTIKEIKSELGVE